MNSIAILITEDTIPMITVLNGGVRPSVGVNGKATYYVCDIDSSNTTTNHDIIDARAFAARRSDFKLMNDFYVSK